MFANITRTYSMFDDHQRPQDLNEYENFMQMFEQVMLEGRRGGAGRDFVVWRSERRKFRISCMEHNNDLNEGDVWTTMLERSYGRSWRSQESVVVGDLGRVQSQSFFFKLVELRRRERTSFHTLSSGENVTNNSKMCESACSIHNETQSCSTWDHYLAYATIKDEEVQLEKQQKRRRWTGWTPIE